MSIENRIIQGVGSDDTDQEAGVAGKDLVGLRTVGVNDDLIKGLLVQQKITNAYLLMLVGESSKVEEADIEIGG